MKREQVAGIESKAPRYETQGALHDNNVILEAWFLPKLWRISFKLYCAGRLPVRVNQVLLAAELLSARAAERPQRGAL